MDLKSYLVEEMRDCMVLLDTGANEVVTPLLQDVWGAVYGCTQQPFWIRGKGETIYGWRQDNTRLPDTVGRSHDEQRRADEMRRCVDPPSK